MAKFRKKPVVIEAIQFLDNVEEVREFMCNFIIKAGIEHDTGKEFIIIPTLEGEMKASYGDFIIQGVNGEFYPCKCDIFWKTYDEVED